MEGKDMPPARTTRILLLLLACCLVPTSVARETSRIDELSKLDLAYMEDQRALLRDIAATNLGRHFSGDRDRDLDLLQTLLDRRLVRHDQTRELQAMGVVMGDLLSSEYGLHWVVLTDKLGRSRALRYHDSDVMLFPITMISRRREVGDNTPVADIYRKAGDIVTRNTRPPLFQ